MDESNPIRDVADTARWVAIYRAMESERSDALFDDPHARRLGGERGEAIVRALPHGGESWPIVVRTVAMDEIVLRCVRDEGVACVLNLAAGFDARPYRLDLPASLHWMHVDVPATIDSYRTQMAAHAPRCALEFVGADLRDAATRREVFTRAAAHGPLLVITEGLLIYLVADHVAALARDLHDIARARWWLSDLASPMLLELLEKRWAPTLRAGNAPFQFGPAEGTAFFAPFGWREAEFRSTWDEAWRIRRVPPMAWLWRLLLRFAPQRRREKFRRMSGIALLQSTELQSTDPQGIAS